MIAWQKSSELRLCPPFAAVPLMAPIYHDPWRVAQIYVYAPIILKESYRSAKYGLRCKKQFVVARCTDGDTTSYCRRWPNYTEAHCPRASLIDGTASVRSRYNSGQSRQPPPNPDPCDTDWPDLHSLQHGHAGACFASIRRKPIEYNLCKNSPDWFGKCFFW